MPDSGGEGQEACGDAGIDAGGGSTAVVFQSELAFQRVEHGLDPLPDAAEFAEPRVLVLAVRADQVRAEVLGDERLERGSGEALVADDDLPGAEQVPVVAEHRLGGFAFADLRVRKTQMIGIPSGVQSR